MFSIEYIFIEADFTDLSDFLVQAPEIEGMEYFDDL
jgi:hypothetical protein